jgi:hypothetical protein
MNKQDKVWLWISAAVAMGMGFILVINGTSAGWFLIILGITFVAVSTGAGQKWATSNPGFARWGLIGVTLFAILLVAAVVAVIVT